LKARQPRRAHDLLAEAREEDPADRDRFLAAACVGDPFLRDEVESLIAVADSGSAEGFLEVPAAESLLAWQADRAPLERGAEIGPFRIIRLLGQGGDGVVYEAEQVRPRRRVALKIPRAKLVTDRTMRRFEAEADHLASLHHPGIAQIYDVGVHGDEAYFALELIGDARPITVFVREHKLDVASRVALVAHACDAIQHAHDRGLLHRDIKPGNVLVTADGHPKVIDFGIALLSELDLDPEPAAGTRPYMSPEQVSPLLDVRSDVFGLGVLLYEVLAGRLPWPEGAAQGPPPAMGLPRRWRGDLEAVARKALQRDREGRYGSARALAQDLRRCLRSEPVAARAPTAGYRLRCWVRRRRAPVAFACVTLAILAAAAVLIARATGEVQQALGRQDTLHEIAQGERAFANLAGADLALLANDLPRARARLEAVPADLRAWEWSYLESRLDDSLATWKPPLRHCSHALIQPDGRIVVAAFGRQELKGVDSRAVGTIWRLDPVDGDAETVSIRPGADDGVKHLALGPDGKWIAVGCLKGSVVLMDARTLEVVGESPGGARAVRSAFIGRDRILAVGEDARFRVFGVPGLEPLASWTDRGEPMAVAAHPEGRWVAVGNKDGSVKLWTASGQEVRSLTAHGAPVLALALSHDGARLASADNRGTIRIHDPESGAEKGVLAVGSAVRSLAFSPAGERLAAGKDDGRIGVYEPLTGHRVADVRGHTDWISFVGFTDDSQSLVSASADGRVKSWRIGTSFGTRTLHEAPSLVMSISYDPVGRRLAAGRFDGAVDVLDVATGKAIATIVAHRRPAVVAFSHDGRRLVTGSRDQTVGIRDATQPDYPRLLELQAAERVEAVACDHAGRIVASGDRARLVTLWDMETGEALARLPHEHTPNDVAFSPDDDLLAVATSSHRLYVWEVATRRIRMRVDIGTAGGVADHTYPKAMVDFSPDGRRVASVARDGSLKLWDVASGRLLGANKVLRYVRDVAFSPDGTRIACADLYGVRIFDASTLRNIIDLRGHLWWVWSVAWSPDGRQLASGAGDYEGRDCTVRLWGPRDR
jgi:WD40 repeat protein/tRNA A-37 threonylcarbamoyl transferase component Bud32